MRFAQLLLLLEGTTWKHFTPVASTEWMKCKLGTSSFKGLHRAKNEEICKGTRVASHSAQRKGTLYLPCHFSIKRKYF